MRKLQSRWVVSGFFPRRVEFHPSIDRTRPATSTHRKTTSTPRESAVIVEHRAQRSGTPMSSNEGGGKFGPGARKAASKALGGAGGIPTPPPRPGASLAIASAAQSAAEDLAAAAPPPRIAPLAPLAPAPAPLAPVPSLSDEAARAKVARAGLRQFKRDYPTSGGIVHTPTGDASAYKVFERNTQGQRVDYVTTAGKAFPDSREPKRYAHIAEDLTPSAAKAALGTQPLSAEESVAARRAATTARTLAYYSEQQRNGGGKHARAALRTVAEGHLSPADVYAGATPAFPQAKRPKGVQYHRDVISGALPVTTGFKIVVENFSDSSEDEEVAALSPREAIHQYRLHTETSAVRKQLSAAAAAAAEEAPTPTPTRRRRRAASPAVPEDFEAEAPLARKRAPPEKEGKARDRKRESKRGRR